MMPIPVYKDLAFGFPAIGRTRGRISGYVLEFCGCLKVWGCCQHGGCSTQSHAAELSLHSGKHISVVWGEAPVFLAIIHFETCLFFLLKLAITVSGFVSKLNQHESVLY